MIYATPPMTPALKGQLDELAELRAALGNEVKTRSRWMGSLRREVRASSIESSTSIEGFSISPEEALALTSGRDVADRDQEDRQAVACYARAMDHVGTLGVDPSFRWVDRVILDLHFDACYFQRDKDPGLWRTGPIGVTAPDGSLEYEGPDGEQVVALMDEVLDWLADSNLEVDVVVRAAMAHLHIVSVHPFRDGNGRVSRIVQSLVLAREGPAAPEFFSIEEYLGSHTQDYYAALREAQGGVVILRVAAQVLLDREELRCGWPLAGEDQRLDDSRDTAVAVPEGVDRDDVKVRHRRPDDNVDLKVAVR